MKKNIQLNNFAETPSPYYRQDPLVDIAKYFLIHTILLIFITLFIFHNVSTANYKSYITINYTINTIKL